MIEVVAVLHGGPEVLHVMETEVPAIGKSDVLVKVRAIGVNWTDVEMRAGRSQWPVGLPHRLGREAAGEVVAIGSEVESISCGQQVLVDAEPACGRCSQCIRGRQNICEAPYRPAIEAPGTYAEYLAIPASAAIPLLPTIDYASAACLQVAFATAHHAVSVEARIRKGEDVLVLPAAGGVGIAAVQFAQVLGARVIAAAGSNAKLEGLRALLPAIDTVNYTTDELPPAVRELSDGKGVDAVVCAVGGELLSAAVRSLAPGGRIVIVGVHGSGGVTWDLSALLRNDQKVMFSRSWLPSDVSSVLELVDASAVRVPISHVIPLTEAARAHEILEARGQIGKVVLKP